MKPINFVGFWTGFDRNNNLFTKTIERLYPFIVSPKAYYLFFSVFGIGQPCFPPTPEARHNYLRDVNLMPFIANHQGLKIFYAGENVRPDFSKCDYAITFDFNNNDCHLRLPLYVLHLNQYPGLLVKSSNFNPKEILKRKTKFCNFVYSNGRSFRRNEFFEKLSKYKKVDSGGKVLNNIEKQVNNKLNFLSDYKFTIAFENSSYPGYVTEKIVDPMLVNSLPIYWGSPVIEKDFNPRSFLNAHDFPTDNALISRIIELDQNDDLYYQYLSEPYFHNNQISQVCQPEYLENFLRKIFQ